MPTCMVMNINAREVESSGLNASEQKGTLLPTGTASIELAGGAEIASTTKLKALAWGK